MRSTTPITLVLSTKTSPPRRWSKTSGDGSRVVVIRDIAILCEAIAALEEFENYLDRIIIDHAATDGELLAMLNRLPPAFRGEVLIASDEWASLSVWNDQGRRTLQNLSARDVGSYLRRYDLTVHLEQLAVA
jgi:hypothetical protein